MREGEDVFLECTVEHQQGKAQWTKDGFALGEYWMTWDSVDDGPSIELIGEETKMYKEWKVVFTSAVPMAVFCVVLIPLPPYSGHIQGYLV